MHGVLTQWACEPIERAIITQHMSSNPMFRIRKENGLPGRLPVAEARECMGIDAPLTCEQVGEAVPPAYAEFIAREALRRQDARRVIDSPDASRPP